MHFVTVFDLSQSGFKDWTFSAFGLIFIVAGALLVFAPNVMLRLMPKGPQGRGRRIFSWFFFCFAICWTALAFGQTYLSYVTLRRDLAAGNYGTVEGAVEHFHPMPYTGHAMESFDVKGVHFEYSDYVETAAFNQTASHGGPIHEGVYVRIDYVGNAIIRLEIRQ